MKIRSTYRTSQPTFPPGRSYHGGPPPIENPAAVRAILRYVLDLMVLHEAQEVVNGVGERLADDVERYVRDH